MPSKYGFGNTRKKSPYKLASYGGDQKNPIKAFFGGDPIENILDPAGFFGGGGMGIAGKKSGKKFKGKKSL